MSIGKHLQEMRSSSSRTSQSVRSEFEKEREALLKQAESLEGHLKQDEFVLRRSGFSIRRDGECVLIERRDYRIQVQVRSNDFLVIERALRGYGPSEIGAFLGQKKARSLEELDLQLAQLIIEQGR
jgi:hypothetical protein